jgi:hypothetical protein
MILPYPSGIDHMICVSDVTCDFHNESLFSILMRVFSKR